MAVNLREADVILLGEADDGFLCEVQAACEKNSAHVVVTDPITFSSFVECRSDENLATVDPDIPLLLRCELAERSRLQYPGTERLAADWPVRIWSACVLMSSPVVNRPGAWGFADRPSRELIVQLLSCAPHLSALVVPEVYADRPLARGTEYETESLAPADLERPVEEGSLPCRMRTRLEEGCFYVQILVAGQLSWIVNEAYGTLDWVRHLSLSVSTALALQFCSIYWRVDLDLRNAKLAKITSNPRVEELGILRSVVADEIARILLA